MIVLYGIERVVPYASGDTDTGEVAEKLQKRYKICELFFRDISQSMEDKFNSLLERNLRGSSRKGFENTLFVMSQWLTNEWRDYIELAKHNLTTKASQERGDPAFIDTGNFYKNLIWEFRNES